MSDEGKELLLDVLTKINERIESVDNGLRDLRVAVIDLSDRQSEFRSSVINALDRLGGDVKRHEAKLKVIESNGQAE